MKRRLLAILIVLAMVFSFSGCSTPNQTGIKEETAQGTLKDGTYEGKANGNNGPLTLTITVKDGKFTKAEVTNHSESLGISDEAIKSIPNAIVEGQTLAVDTISGATNSSEGILEAAAECIKAAGGNPEDFKIAAAKKEAEGSAEVEKIETDVLVIGAGMSGISSSLAAANNGVDVILLEKQSFAGGNAILSTGILQAAGSKLQAASSIEDSYQKYFDDMMTLTDGKRDPILVKMVTERSGETIDWLIENGAIFNEEVTQGVGSTAYRAHSSAPDASGLVNKLMEKIEQKADVRYNTAATELIVEDGRVVGAKAVRTDGTSLEIRAKSVILSCGGFAGDKELVKKYAGEKTENMVYVGSPGTTGEMIEEAIKLGAATVDMDQLFNAPTNSVENKQLITAMVLSSGAVMINQDGERFCNETGSPNDYFNDILNTGDEYVFEVFDNNVVEKVYKLKEVYMKQGIVEEAATIEELAEKMKVPVEALKQSIETYNASVNGAPDPFGRNIFGEPLQEGPYYFIKVATGYLSTNGGLKIDEAARVLKEGGTVIEGLYAAGDAVGGYRPYGYVCGDANILAAVTGRIAGENASK